MMSHYFKKQLKIGIGWIIVLAIIVAGIYFLFIGNQTPTCFDGKKNQNEEGIDCGGPCKTCSPAESLNIISQIFIPTTVNNYDLVAKIKNPNSDQGADIVNYEFSLYDSTNQLIGTKTGNTYFLPQETKYIVEQKFYTDKAIARIEFKFNDISWIKLSQINDLELRIKNAEYQITEDGSNLLVGTIENKSSYDLDTIKIVGVLFDENKNIIAAGETSINTVLRNESRGFEIFWPYPISVQVKSFDVKVYTDVFENDNFIKTHGEPGSVGQ
jgi:hypothetical protein